MFVRDDTLRLGGRVGFVCLATVRERVNSLGCLPHGLPVARKSIRIFLNVELCTRRQSHTASWPALPQAFDAAAHQRRHSRLPTGCDIQSLSMKLKEMPITFHRACH